MRRHCIATSVCLIAFVAAPAGGEEADLAKQTQNPIANLISLPFQNNLNFGVGPDNDLQYVLNIQPVIPVELGPKVRLINRPILPVMYQPELGDGLGKEWGLGNLTYQGFLSPISDSSVTWGAGPVISFPTNTDDIFGSDRWSAGPGAVVVWMPGNWVVGGLATHVWDFAGPSSAPPVSFTTLQYFLNYNFPAGFYLSSAPVITADWEAKSGDKWTLPFGGGIGKVFRFGGGVPPVNAQIQAFYNAVHPDDAASWQLRLQFQFLFPR